jgi:hypothetical protein
MKHGLLITTTCAALLALATFVPDEARAQQKLDQARLEALGAVYSLDLMGGLLKSWCDERAPQSASAHAAAHEAWRKKFSLDRVEARVGQTYGASTLEKLAAGVEEKRAAAYSGFDKEMNNPTAVC